MIDSALLQHISIYALKTESISLEIANVINNIMNSVSIGIQELDIEMTLTQYKMLMKTCLDDLNVDIVISWTKEDITSYVENFIQRYKMHLYFALIPLEFEGHIFTVPVFKDFFILN